MEFKLLKPFGPSVVKTQIPEKMVNDLNEYIDQIINDKKKLDLLNYGNKLAGDVSQEFKLEADFAKKVGWTDFLAKAVYAWIDKELNEKITKFNTIQTWIVRQFENEYNPVHWHSGHISGAGYLKTPKNFGTFIQNKEKNYQGGSLSLIHGSKQFLSSSVLEIKPKVGDFYFFPHYMMHTVYPFKETNEERRSISFNAVIDEEIFNQ
tara:strand:+ start:79 stop:699 length:621 start_codon:yes stop_codon:yes gene_type:complete